MGFLIHSVKDGHIPPWEWKPADDAAYQVGDALVFSSNHLVAVSSGVGEDTDEGPHYICMADVTVGTDGDLIPVIKAAPGIIFKSTLSAEDTDIARGSKYTLHTDARQITGTTTKGVFLVDRFDGTASGSAVYGEIID